MSPSEPSDAEISSGQYQPYQSHQAPAGGELQPMPTQLPAARTKKEREAEALVGNQKFALAIVSLGAGIPITAIAATQVTPSLLGVAVAWAGIVGVNIVHHISRRKDR